MKRIRSSGIDTETNNSVKNRKLSYFPAYCFNNQKFQLKLKIIAAVPKSVKYYTLQHSFNINLGIKI